MTIKAFPVMGWLRERKQYYGYLRLMRRHARMLADAHAHERWWQERIAVVKLCPDNRFIPRCAGAGEIQGDIQILHNGLKVAYGSYCGVLNHRLLEENKGVHEPQEERVFAQVLVHMQPGSTILELGAYWAFYSLWFCREVAHARCVMVEPVLEFMNMGRLNFMLNGLKGEFIAAFVGSSPRDSRADVPTVSVDSLVRERSMDRVAVLHCDVQGHELEMLDGAAQSLRERIIDYLFISTHSNYIHRRCLEAVARQGYTVIAQHDCDESYSVDGLVVARRQELNGIGVIDIARRRK